MATTKTLVAAGLVALFAVPASASTLDFETGFAGDVTALGNGPVNFAGFDGSFSSPNGINIVQVGNPTDGFVPNDTPQPAGIFGDFFLTSDFGTVTSLIIDYTTPVSAASFQLADIDGNQDSAGNTEVFTFTLFNGAAQVGPVKTITAGDPGTGDAVVTDVGFSGLGTFDRIVISGTTSGGTRNIGIAFDNFNATVDSTIPLPAAVWMLLAGIGGLGVVSRKKRAAA